MLRKEILRKQKNFNSVYNKGKSIANKYSVVISRKNNLGYTRTAYVASKKVGNSVKRNRARRLMREAYRNISPDVRSGFDIIFVARSSITDHKCPEVEAAMRKTLRSSGLLKQ
jgi:ribonuclease P protein component